MNFYAIIPFEMQVQLKKVPFTILFSYIIHGGLILKWPIADGTIWSVPSSFKATHNECSAWKRYVTESVPVKVHVADNHLKWFSYT